MKIDLDYLKKMLLAFESSDKAYTTINQLKNYDLDCSSEDFVFHLQILTDKGLIETEFGNKDLGFSRLGNGIVTWTIRNLRLTSAGHDFLEAIKNNTVWTKIKTEFKENGITTIVEFARSLLIEIISKKIYNN